MTSIVRTASVQWRGDFARGRGDVTGGSGRLHAEYSFDTRFSGAPGTNPEELLGGALGSCFSMAFALLLGRASVAVELIVTRVDVRLEQQSSGYEISGLHVKTVATLAGISSASLRAIAEEAAATCPLGKALSAVPMTLEVSQTAPESSEDA